MTHANPADLAQPGSQSQVSLGTGHDAHGHDGHGHSPYLAHHFDDLQQQKDADVLGMWAFLATEVMFFGGLFTAFTIYRLRYPDVFAEASRHMHTWIGALNTGVLLVSSFTVVLAVAAAQRGDRMGIVRNLLFTILLASTFVAVKGYEYYSEYTENLVPFVGFEFHYDDPAVANVGTLHAEAAHGHPPRTAAFAPQARIYFAIYFIMTAIHATHMVIGIGVFAVIAYKAWKGRYAAEYYNPVEISGLYWHFVDLVWVFLFPLLYLLH